MCTQHCGGRLSDSEKKTGLGKTKKPSTKGEKKKEGKTEKVGVRWEATRKQLAIQSKTKDTFGSRVVEKGRKLKSAGL